MSDKLRAILVIGGFLLVMYGPMGMYLWKGWFKWFFHDILKWHKPDNQPMWFDGCSTHAHCKYCGHEIMQDSQGNWF